MGYHPPVRTHCIRESPAVLSDRVHRRADAGQDVVAVINNFGGFYNRELYFHELKKTGATIHAPCVNNSAYLTSVRGTDVYIGLIHLEGLEKKSR